MCGLWNLSLRGSGEAWGQYETAVAAFVAAQACSSVAGGPTVWAGDECGVFEVGWSVEVGFMALFDVVFEVGIMLFA